MEEPDPSGLLKNTINNPAQIASMPRKNEKLLTDRIKISINEVLDSDKSTVIKILKIEITTLIPIILMLQLMMSSKIGSNSRRNM